MYGNAKKEREKKESRAEGEKTELKRFQGQENVW